MGGNEVNGSRIGIVIHTDLRDLLFSPEDKARMKGLGKVVWTDSPTPLSVESACELLAECEIGVGSWRTPFPTEELLKACRRLRLWEHVAGSVKHMFGPHLDGRDLMIASCATALADCVAEMTLGELIIGLKRVLDDSAANRCGRPFPKAGMKTLSSSVVGVIGASHVGRRVIALLRPFGCEILLYDPFVSEAEADEMGVRLVKELVELCSASNAVTLHTPALPTTEKVIGAREFQAMRDDALFINTARGMCVDEEALITELKKGRLFAFLDVTHPEPPTEDSPLRKLPNVVYTSHIAGLADFKMGKQAVDDVAAFLQGGAPLYVVTADMLDRIA